MLGNFQKTLSKPIKIKGIGLHSGLISNVVLKPSLPNTGITFVRTDKNGDRNVIKADYKNVASAKLCTVLKNSYGISVSTTEHLLGALCGEGIDNVIVEVDNLEIPIMDGSALAFTKLIKASGVKEQNVPKKFIEVLKKVEIKEGLKFISIEPLKNDFKIDFTLVYKNELIGSQREILSLSKGDLNTIYKARTFCLYEDIEKIKANGFGKGGSLDNAIVVKGDEILNENGLRDKNEFVKHKILDCLGDFMLSGYRVFGLVKCIRGGHQLTNDLLQKFLSNKSNWQLASRGVEDLKNIKNYNDNARMAVNA